MAFRRHVREFFGALLVACPSFTATVFERSMAFVLERFQKEKQVSKTD